MVKIRLTLDETQEETGNQDVGEVSADTSHNGLERIEEV